MPSETWKAIPFAPDYAVSDLGRVMRVTGSARQAKAGRILKQRPSGHKKLYLGLNIVIDGKAKTFLVHRLVALVFIGDPPTPQHEVAHGDGDEHNNRLSNLRWATRSDNHADKVEHGTDKRGRKHHNVKLAEDDVRSIRAAQWGQVGALAARYGVSPGTIKDIRARKTWAWLA